MSIRKIFRIFFAGDVMIGRGIDQVLPYSVDPKLYEPFVTDAREYVQLAEEACGKFPHPVTVDYIWGDCLAIWQQFRPDLKIVNLETTMTLSDDYWPDKGINYRAHPNNIDVLTTAGFNICTLANNHMLDWGYSGLEETLATLTKAKILFAGAGRNSYQAMQPAIVSLNSDRRLLIFSCCHPSSGVIPFWSATPNRPGVFFLLELNLETIKLLRRYINEYKQPGDLIVLSIHWGNNWGYHIPPSFRAFAYAMIDNKCVDIIHGHSSHHPRSIEIYQNKPIFYGCGDFINDYEGINNYQYYRNDLTLMYFLDFDLDSLSFKKMTLIPLQVKNFRLHRASKEDCEFLLKRLNQSASFSTPLLLKDQKLFYFVANSKIPHFVPRKKIK